MSITHIQEHVDLIAKHEAEFLAHRTRTERVSDRIAQFVGSLPFVAVHLMIFAVWILWNTLLPLPRFDAEPFALLQTLVAMESILVASFILMRQARLGRRSDERDHLMLQILLLTEKEITAVLGMDRQIARQVGLSKLANTVEIRQLSQHISIDDVAQKVKERFTDDKAADGARHEPEDPFDELFRSK